LFSPRPHFGGNNHPRTVLKTPVYIIPQEVVSPKQGPGETPLYPPQIWGAQTRQIGNGKMKTFQRAFPSVSPRGTKSASQNGPGCKKRLYLVKITPIKPFKPGPKIYPKLKPSPFK